MGGKLSRTKVQEANDALCTFLLMSQYRSDKKFRDAVQTLFTYVNKPRHVVGVSVLLTDGNGNVLLGKRGPMVTGSGLYSTPGGKVDLGEEIRDAAVRETKEECGIDLSLYRDCFSILGHKQHARWGDNSVIFYLHLRLTNKELIGKIFNTEPDKCEGWEWWPLSNLPAYENMTEPPDVIHMLQVREEQD
jgi:8-oxo-dGTP diphosphatase